MESKHGKLGFLLGKGNIDYLLIPFDALILVFTASRDIALV